MRSYVIVCLVLSGFISPQTASMQHQHIRGRNKEDRNRLVQKGAKYNEKRDETDELQPISLQEEDNFPRKDASSEFLPDSSLDSSCCDTSETESGSGSASFSRKDVLVKNPQKVHFFKKIVGKRFRNILKALKGENTKAAQAIKRKIHDGDLSKMLSESTNDDKDEKVSIYNIEGKSELSRNKTIIELRHAILKLLDKVQKKSKSHRRAKEKSRRRDYQHKDTLPRKIEDNKFTKAEIQENGYKEEANSPSTDDDNLSAKQANTLDLLNFIARMKGFEFAGADNPYSVTRMQRMNAMRMSGLGNMLNARDMMRQGPIDSIQGPMNPMSGMQEVQHREENQDVRNEQPPGDGMQIQEMNLAEQRKLIEDQMQNHLTELQLKARLKDLQQEVAPLQNLQSEYRPTFGPSIDPMQKFQNDIQSKLGSGIDNSIPSQGAMPFGLDPMQKYQNDIQANLKLGPSFDNSMASQGAMPFGLDPMQNRQNDIQSNFGPGFDNGMSSQGIMPFGLGGQRAGYQAALPRLNPFLPMVRPLSRFRPRLPFFGRFHRRFHYPATSYDDDDDNSDDDDDEDEDDGRFHSRAPARTLPSDDDDDGDDNDNDEPNDSDNDDR